MPKHGDRVSGRFNEVLHPSQPIVWDSEPKYFKLPPTPEAQDERTQIARRLAAAVKRAQAAQPRQVSGPVAPRGGTYFKIPAQGD